MTFLFLSLFSAAALAGAPQQLKAPPQPSVETLLDVKRVYVDQLTGGVRADALRELIISSLQGTKLFILTDNPDRADATLKGAGDDNTFTDIFDSQQNANVHESAGSSVYSRAGGARYAVGASDNESHHIVERRHEAYAAVRLCNRDGDVLWSTTQESLGAKFRGASADVAAKVARQLTADFERARRAGTGAPALAPATKP